MNPGVLPVTARSHARAIINQPPRTEPLHFIKTSPKPSMDHEKSYVFTGERTTKRRRIEPSGLDSSWPLREKIYRQLWTQQQEAIDKVLDNANRVTLDELSKFTQTAKEENSGRRLPCGLILAGPSIAAHTTLFEQLAERITEETSMTFALVTSTDAPNLKTVLKAIIKSATSRKSLDDDEMELVSASRKGPKLLNYDLQLLHDWVQENGVEQVVVSFRDIEAFDSNVLSETIEQLGYACLSTSMGNVTDVYSASGLIASHSCYSSASRHLSRICKTGFLNPQYATWMVTNSTLYRQTIFWKISFLLLPEVEQHPFDLVLN